MIHLPGQPDTARLRATRRGGTWAGRAMKLIPLVLSALVLIICAMQPRVPRAADANCLTSFQETAKRTRGQVNVYLNEMKGMVGDPWARNSASVCSSALARAEQYSKRQVATNSLCTGSSYVDSQALQLYKTANSTCRAEFSNVLSKMTPDEQRLVNDRVVRAEAALR
jgi:hypothetical protein